MNKRNPAPAPRRRQRLLKRWMLALVSLGLAAAAARLEFIWVISTKNGEFAFARYRFFEESAEHPRLRLLRQREKLDQVVAPGKTQFEKLVLLRKWAHGQWQSQDRPFYYPPWDALEILDLVRKHHNYGFCGQYAVVFTQACLALGMHARYVDVGHFLSEAWSEELNDWVVMDPTNDLHYERDGAPMDGRDLAGAAWRNTTEGIFKVSSDGSRAPVSGDELAGWRHYKIITRNNHLTDPIRIKNRFGVLRPLTVQEDYTRYPLVGRDKVVWEGAGLTWIPSDHIPPGEPADIQLSDDSQDFHFAYNQTFIFLESKNAKTGLVKLKLLAEHAPEFQSFVINEQYSVQADGEVFLHLKPGLTTLSARVKTKFGWLGPESSIKIVFKRDWLRR